MTQGPHVCIVGAGIMGICTAFYLAKSRECQSITIVEEGEPASGASGKAGGFLARDWHGPPTSSVGILSYKLHEELADELNGKERYGYRDTPTISFVIQEGHNQPPHVLETEPSFSWLSKENMAELEYSGRTKSTAQVHPYQFCHTLLEESKQMGVSVIQARATALETVGKEYSELHYTLSKSGEKGSVRADKFVLAAGPWTGKLLKSLFNTELPIHELPGHSMIIETRRPLPALAGFGTAKDYKGFATQTPEFFTRPDGTIYVAGENTGAPLPPGIDAVSMEEASLDRLVAVCKLLSPLLDVSNEDHVSSVHKALCYRPVTSRGYPYICSLEQLQLPHVFVMAGHGPWGISLGPGSGKAISELVLYGKATSANIDYLGL